MARMLQSLRNYLGIAGIVLFVFDWSRMGTNDAETEGNRHPVAGFYCIGRVYEPGPGHSNPNECGSAHGIDIYTFR